MANSVDSDQTGSLIWVCTVWICHLVRKVKYDNCPKISYTKVSDKMSYTNRAVPDHTAPEGAV